MLMLLAAAGAVVAGATPGAAAKPACPATFEAFAAKFQTDVAFQKARTAPVVATSRVDAAARPEPKTVRGRLPRARVEFPVMPSRRDMREESIRLRIVGAGGATPSLVLTQEDTGYLLRLGFARDEGCWRLVSVDDQST